MRLAIHILDPPDLAALLNQVIFDDVDLVLNNLIGIGWQQESLVVEWWLHRQLVNLLWEACLLSWIIIYDLAHKLLLVIGINSLLLEVD